MANFKDTTNGQGRPSTYAPLVSSLNESSELRDCNYNSYPIFLDMHFLEKTHCDMYDSSDAL